MIIADSGFWVAIANRKDAHSQRALEVVEVLSEPLVTTWPVVTEATHLLTKHAGIVVSTRFLEMIFSGSVQLFSLTQEHGPRTLQLIKKYRDLPMDLADASLVILAEHLGHGRILSTDQRDFKSYRWKNHHPFENLLFCT